MSGAGGHISHLHEDLDLTFDDIKAVLRSASQGTLENVTEKFDGLNLMFTWYESRGGVKVARGINDIRSGGLSQTDLAKKFQSRGSLSTAMNESFTTLQKAISNISPVDKREIFGRNGDRWFSIEVIYPESANVINYDCNRIVFHGHPVMTSTSHGVVRSSNDQHFSRLSECIDQMNKAVSIRKWKVSAPVIVKLSTISDGTLLDSHLSELDALLMSENSPSSSTLREYVRRCVRRSFKTFCSEHNLTMSAENFNRVCDRVARMQGSMSLTDIKRYLPASQVKHVQEFVHSEDELVKEAIFPVEMVIHKFSSQLLKNLKSAFVESHEAEAVRIQEELSQALDVLEDAPKLSKHVTKLESDQPIMIEGVVFIYKGNAYKFTGRFAPVNAILGTLKYSR